MNVNTPTVTPSTSCARTHCPKTRLAMRRTAQTSNRHSGGRLRSNVSVSATRSFSR